MHTASKERIGATHPSYISYHLKSEVSIIGLKRIVVFTIRIFFIHNYRIFEYSFQHWYGREINNPVVQDVSLIRFRINMI